MAVAVKTTPEANPRDPQQQTMMVGSLVGAGYLLFSFWLIFSGLPTGWFALGEQLGLLQGNIFLATALLLLATIPVLVGVIFLGWVLVATNPPPGTRAGAVILAFAFAVVAGLGLWIGTLLEAALLGYVIEVMLTVLVVAGLAVGAGFLFFLAANTGWLQNVEQQGWFHAASFKPSQGLRVRRGTMAALFLLFLFGIITLMGSHTIPTAPWNVRIPFTGGRYFPILYQASVTVPLLLFVGSVWVSWRVINFPAFADFLIATEAEINKVSWTTRKKLVQDTIVVLVTVLLFTVFLFLVDILWIKVLSNPVLRVLDVNPMEEKAKQNAPTQW